MKSDIRSYMPVDLLAALDQAVASNRAEDGAQIIDNFYHWWMQESATVPMERLLAQRELAQTMLNYIHDCLRKA